MPLYDLICLGMATPDADTLIKLLDEAVKVLGPGLTFALLIVLFVGSLVNKWFAARRRERIYERVEKEKDRTIKRLSDDNLELRMIVLKEMGHWSTDDVIKIVLQNRFVDSIDPQHVLKGEHIARKTHNEVTDAPERRTPRLTGDKTERGTSR